MNTTLKYIFLLFSWGILATNTFAQNSNSEQVFVHINRNILLSGSTLKYTAYITNQLDTNLSSYTYFRLVDIENNTVLSWNSTSNNQTTSGSITIPEKLKNGIYQLYAYTYKMRNYPAQKIFNTPIIIQRIYENVDDTIQINSLLTTDYLIKQTPEKENPYFDIIIEQKDELSIEIKPKSEINHAQLSISISENSEILTKANYLNFSEFIKETSEINTPHSELPKEIGHNFLVGRVLHLPDSIPLNEKLIYLAYKDSTVHFKSFFTNNKGEFCFILDSSFHNKNLYLQVDDNNCINDSIAWIIDTKNIDVNTDLNISKQILSPSQKHYIEELQKREIINRVYNPHTIKTTNEQKSQQIENFFGQATYTAIPNDFIDLPNFQEICDNIIPSLRFRIENHKPQIGIVIGQQIKFNDVLICVNGLPCFNMNYIENLSSKDIKRIETFNSVIIHGKLTFNGVLCIYTNKYEIDERMFCTPVYSHKHSVSSNSILTTDFTDKNSPNILPDVFWCSNYTIKNKDHRKLKIPIPAIGTSYTLRINGLINSTIPFAFEQQLNFKK